MKHFLTLSAIFALPALTQAQEAIITDRPDFIEASLTVGKGIWQLENGMTFLRHNGLSQTNLPETLIRHGLSARTEIRLGVPNYFWVRGANRATGFSDAYLGVKWQMTPSDSPVTVALIPALTLPLGDRRLRGEAIASELKICLSTSLSERYALSGMTYIRDPKEDGRRNVTLQNTLSLSQTLTNRMGAFYEIALTNPRRGAPENQFHTGFTYQSTPNQQWDIHLAVGPSPAAADALFAFGYSVRFR
jgi:Putative MetA-pathway of phenol degradation